VSTPADLRRARAAAALAFFLTGAVFATWAARLPSIQERLDLSPGGLSIALVGMEAGALVGLAIGGRIVARLESPPSLRLGFVLYPPALVAAAVAPSLAYLVAAVAIMGAANSVIDVAINVQGVELERRFARPLLSGLHSAHSFGVLGGGLAGTALAVAEVPLATHVAVAAAVAMAASQASIGRLVREDREPARRVPGRRRGVPGRRRRVLARFRRVLGRRPRLPDSALATPGLLAFAAFFVEGAANDWSAVHLRSTHATSAAVAAAAFTAFSLALALGRAIGDRLATRHGRGPLVRAAAMTAALGAGLVVAAPSAPVAIAGWSLLGLGMAPIAPVLLGSAANVATASPPAAIATVSAIGYAGAFAGPPLIGALAEVVSLPAALGLLGIAALAIALRAPYALADHPPSRSHERTTPPPTPRAEGDIAPASSQYYDPNQRTTSP
jgi:MFS family permease